MIRINHIKGIARELLRFNMHLSKHERLALNLCSVHLSPRLQKHQNSHGPLAKTEIVLESSS